LAAKSADEQEQNVSETLWISWYIYTTSS
jgi:hypothetical protein